MSTDFPIRQELHFIRFAVFPLENWGSSLQREIPTDVNGNLDVDRLARIDTEIADLMALDEYDEFQPELENGDRLHGDRHGWVGRSMILWSSPNDPIFWMHHANVDRLWASWQEKQKQQWLSENPGQGYTYDKHYHVSDPTNPTAHGHKLNDPMWPWDNGASQSAKYTPNEEVGTTLPSNIRRELNKFVFAGRALPSNLDLPSISDSRTPADVLDSVAMGVEYSELVT